MFLFVYSLFAFLVCRDVFCARGKLAGPCAPPLVVSLVLFTHVTQSLLENLCVCDQLQEPVVYCDVPSIDQLVSTGEFFPSMLLYLSNDTRCCQMLLYFFRCPLIRHDTSVPVFRGSFVFSTLLLDVVSDELCCQLYALSPPFTL